MLNGIHFLLTYTCNFECDHCFLYCSPWSQGTFTLGQVIQVLDEAEKMGSVEWIFFEGGEPFLFYPLLQEGIQRAATRGFKVGVVTNAYGAISEEDAELWLAPLADVGLTYLSVSNDQYHYGEEAENPATIAHRVAQRLGIDTAPIRIEAPVVTEAADGANKGQPVVGGGPKFRGRAVEKLAGGLPLRPWQDLKECPYEELESPSRVHVDAFGHVQVCQGVSIGNMWKTPLSEILAGYRADAHPICGPLLRGGPAELARACGQAPAPGYIDECHLCYLTRRTVIDRYPEALAPKQVYGLE
jgi:hypothetical protein